MSCLVTYTKYFIPYSKLRRHTSDPNVVKMKNPEFSKLGAATIARYLKQGL